MSSAFISTPIGSIPKQENFKVAGIFNTGFIDFDQNVIFLKIEDALSIFDKEESKVKFRDFLNNPLNANTIKSKIQNINQNYFIYTWSDLK